MNGMAWLPVLCFWLQKIRPSAAALGTNFLDCEGPAAIRAATFLECVGSAWLECVL